MAKVFLHLKAIEKHGKLDADLLNHLGNEEVSDSYLLDIYCSKHCNNCFEKVLKCLKYAEADSSCEKLVSQITVKDYLDEKAKKIKLFTKLSEDNANEKVPRNVQITIRSPSEIRGVVKKYYAGNKKRLGKDLFIVFTNLAKQTWKTDREAFDEYTYLAINVYDNLDRIVDCEFDPFRDLILWGTLLKTDLYGYVAQARFPNAPAGYATVTSITFPTHIEKKLFSINNYQETMRQEFTQVAGGESKAKVIEELMQ